MQRANVDPWTWQNGFGFSQAVDVNEPRRILFCSGQTSVDANGTVQHPGDMRAQLFQARDNLGTVLESAGLGFGDVARLNVYTVDVEGLLQHWDAFIEAINAAGSRPASTLIGVTRLAFPELLVEIEATAVS